MTDDKRQRAHDETRQAWNRNAAYWDGRMGEGNDFVEVLSWPATERLLGACSPGSGFWTWPVATASPRGGWRPWGPRWWPLISPAR